MKKFLLLLLPGALFPYSLLFSLFCVFTGFLMESCFDNHVFTLLFYLLIWFILAFVCNLVFLALSIVREWSAQTLSLANMLVKLIQIPAYALIFVLGVLFLVTIFTFGFSIFFFIFDCLAIFLTGLTGIASVVRCYKEGKTAKTLSVVHGVLQFVFCADVISAVMVYIQSRSKPVKMGPPILY